MNDDEASRYFDAIGRQVEATGPPTAKLIAAGRKARRRRTQSTVVGLAAAVTLLVGGGAVAQQAASGHRTDPIGLNVTDSDTPTTPDDTRLVSVGRVAVAVPNNWMSTPNGCEDVLSGGRTYVHSPGSLETATCGTVQSLTVVPADSSLGRALIRYPLEERLINGITARVGDSCLPTAACIYPNGMLAYLPDDDVVLLVSDGTAPDDNIAEDIVDSIQFPPKGFTG